jgi:hypothetical protein
VVGSDLDGRGTRADQRAAVIGDTAGRSAAVSLELGWDGTPVVGAHHEGLGRGRGGR